MSNQVQVVSNGEQSFATQGDKPQTLKEWISGPQFKDAIAKALPSHMTVDRFVRVCLTALMKTPKLKDCTQTSIFKAILDLSSIGLEPDGRRAHLIPYKNRKANITEAQLIIDYKGYIELAKRADDGLTWRAELVCEEDSFSWCNGIVDHKIDWLRPRGKPLAVYSHVRYRNGVDEYVVMTLAEVEEIRKRSKSKDSGPWSTDYSEMVKKTVMRRHSKYLVLSPEFHDALSKDGDSLVLEAEAAPVPDMSPKSLSGKGPEQLTAKAEASEAAPVATSGYAAPADEDLKIITSANMAKISKAIKQAGISQQVWTDHLGAEYGAETLSAMRDRDVERFLSWIQGQDSNVERTPAQGSML